MFAGHTGHFIGFVVLRLNVNCAVLQFHRTTMSSEEQAASDPVFVRHVPRELLEDLRSRVLHYVAEAKDFSAEIHQIAGKPPQLVLSLGGKSGKNNFFFFFFFFFMTNITL